MNLFMRQLFLDHLQNIINLKELEEEVQAQYKKNKIIKNQFQNQVHFKKEMCLFLNLEGIMIVEIYLFELIIKIHNLN